MHMIRLSLMSSGNGLQYTWLIPGTTQRRREATTVVSNVGNEIHSARTLPRRSSTPSYMRLSKSIHIWIFFCDVKIQSHKVFKLHGS